MQKEISGEEGSNPTSNSTVGCIDKEKVTFRTSCSSCGSMKRISQAAEENPRKKINLFDPYNPLSPCTSNVSAKPTILSSLKPSQDNFSFNWPPPFRQSQCSCNPNTQEAIKTMETNPPQQKVLDLDRKASFSDSSPDIIKNPPEFIKPATTPPPLFLLDPVAAPKSNENITALTKHPLSRLPSGESVAIGCSAPKPELIRGYNYAEALKRRKCAKILRFKEEEAKVEAVCNDESKKKTVLVVGSNEGNLGGSTRTLQFKCKCGRVCEFVIFQ